jgi:CheY-like chemotaxis protein
MHALYEAQKQTLELVRSRLGPATPSPVPPEIGVPLVGEGFAAYPAAPTRARRRKSVLLVDDDEAAREPAVAALKQAKIPVRTAADGREALAAISTESPDVIVLEPNLSSRHGVGDLLAKIKAKAEWSHIPIVLYMRKVDESQKRTRATYGADRLVLKGPRGPAALVSQVITLFRGS